VKGDVVCLLMTNRPEYFAIWLGITSVGAIVSLLNTNLVVLRSHIASDIVSPKHLIVSAEFVETLIKALRSLRQTQPCGHTA